MAISPISDIVLEVAKAADPKSYSEAAARLGRLAGTAAPATAASLPETFAETLGGVKARAPVAPHVPFDPALALVRMQNHDALAAQPAKPQEQFEAFVLSNFVETMLPKDSEVLFGGGTAGEIWKSMLAQGLGTQLARVGGIGIAHMLSADAAGPAGKDGATDAAEGPAAPVCS